MVHVTADTMTPPDAAPASNRVLEISLAAGVLLSLAVTVAVATQSLLVGSRAGRWVYGYVAPFSLRPLLISVGVAAAASGLLHLTSRARPGHAWAVVAVWMAAGLAVQGALRSSTPATLERIFVSDGANSFHSAAQQHQPGDLLRRFDRIRARAPLHAQSNMPGKILLVRALQQLTPRTDVLPWLVVIVSNLGAALMYLVVRDLLGDRRAAVYAAVFYLVVPGRLLFLPLMNTVTPVVILACAWLCIRWLATGRALFAVLFAVALYGLVFFEPLPLVMGLLFGALAVHAAATGALSGERLVLQGAAVPLVFIATAELVELLTGFDAVRAFRGIAAHAAAFNETAGRPYGTWVRANLGEFLFGVGLCQAALAAGVLGQALGREEPWKARLARPILVVCLALVAVLAATDLIGVNRGEVVRLWIFLACFYQIPAAWACARFTGPLPAALVASTSILQAGMGTAMIGFVVP